MNRKNTLMQKMDKNKGFTLAELLIVVAIIAVLVAISIPIFSSQLEKAREATDLANVRIAYAEVMAAAITDEEAEPITVSLVQKQDDFQTAGEINIGGITKANKTQWVGIPRGGGSAKVSYDSNIGAIIQWSGGISTQRGNWYNGNYSGNANDAISTYNSARADGKYELESGKTYTISCTYNIGKNNKNNYALLASAVLLFDSNNRCIYDTSSTELYTGTDLHSFSNNASEGTGYKYTDNGDGTYTYTATFKTPTTSDGKCYFAMNFFGRDTTNVNKGSVKLSEFMTDQQVDTANSQMEATFMIEESSSN